MESNSTTHRYVYTKEQLFEIRDAFISSGGPNRYSVRCFMFRIITFS